MIARVVAALTATFFLLPVLATWQPGVPVGLRLVVLVIATAALWRPSWGLMLVAGLMPVATPLHVIAGAPFSGAETVELLVAPLVMAVALRVAVIGLQVPLRLLAPALVLASALAAVATVQLSVLSQTLVAGNSLTAAVSAYLVGPYYLDPGRYPPLHGFVSWCGALALAVIAEYVLRSAPPSRAAVLRVVAVGITAGAAMALYRLIEVSIRAPAPFQMAWEVVSSVRFNPHFADLNAAGSLYALVLVPTVSWAATTRHRVLWGSAAVVALALWMTGSRAALVGAIFGLGLVWVCQRRPPLGRVVLVVLALLPVVWLGTQYTRTAQVAPGTAIGVRSELFRVGTELATEAPIFGLGFRSFQSASTRRISPDLMERYPGLEHGENAHNNFMQVLVEFGLVGLVSFLWLLAAAVRPTVEDLRGRRANPAAVGLAGGVAAFLVTCLAGHPLLIVQVLVPFGLMLGLLAGAATGATRAASPGGIRWSVAALATLLLLSAIPRAAAAGAAAPLDGVVVGAELAGDPAAGLAWTLEHHGRWYLAADTRVVLLRLRLMSGDPAVCRYSVEVDGRLFARDGLLRAESIRLVVAIPPSDRARLSHRVDIALTGPGCIALVEDVASRS